MVDYHNDEHFSALIKDQHNLEFQARYGNLYKDYQRRFFFWGKRGGALLSM